MIQTMVFFFYLHPCPDDFSLASLSKYIPDIFKTNEVNLRRALKDFINPLAPAVYGKNESFTPAADSKKIEC